MIKTVNVFVGMKILDFPGYFLHTPPLSFICSLSLPCSFADALHTRDLSKVSLTLTLFRMGTMSKPYLYNKHLVGKRCLFDIAP